MPVRCLPFCHGLVEILVKTVAPPSVEQPRARYSPEREEYPFEKCRNLDVTVVRRIQTIFQPVETRPI